MNWFWINIPLDAVFFLAVAGIPLWLVIKHPDTGPAAGHLAGLPQPGHGESALAAATQLAVTSPRVAGSRELAAAAR